jgi:hypothetical protein
MMLQVDFVDRIFQSDWTALRELYLSEPGCRICLFPDDRERLEHLGLVQSRKADASASIVTTLTDQGRAAMKDAYERFGFAGPELPVRLRPDGAVLGSA